MGFVIRQIARRADGGEIVRTRTLDVPEITVGRGTDCDIQLADLGVMLRHARLSLLAGGMVAVEAMGGIPLEIGGAFVNRAELDTDEAPTIDMASHRLTLGRGEVPGSVAVTAERVIAAGDGADGDAETGIFSLVGTVPGKRVMAWSLVAVVLLGSLALPLWMLWSHEPVAAARDKGFKPDMVWSSGPLSTAHAGLSNKCGACHQAAFVSVTDGACVACHKADAVPAHAPEARMVTGRLPATGVVAKIHAGMNLPEGRCASCHREHEGPRGALLVAANYCTDCHAGLSERLQDTRLADVAGWEKHPEFRPTVVKAPSPVSPRFERVLLSRPPRENSGLVYPHALHLSKTNAVANMVQKQRLGGAALGCAYCHVPDSDRVRFQPITMEKNCSACHDLAFARDGGVVRTLPHGKPEQVAGIIRDFQVSQGLRPRAGVVPIAFERRVPGVSAPANLRPTGADAAIARVFGRGGICADCHAVTDSGTGDAATRYRIMPVTLGNHYLPKGRFPHGRHKSFGGKTGDAACVACHTGVPASKLASDVLLPPVATCRECHGSAKVATNVPADCNTCHGFHFGDGGHGGDTDRRRLAAPSPRALPSTAGGR